MTTKCHIRRPQIHPNNNNVEPNSHITARAQSKKPGPEVIKQFIYSTQLSTKCILLINVKMTTIVGILTFISMIKYIT